MEEFISKILDKHNRKKGHLIPVLQEIQREKGHLSEEVLQSVSDGLGVPVNRIYGVATFYDEFLFKPSDKVREKSQPGPFVPVVISEEDKTFLLDRVLKSSSEVYRKDETERLAVLKREKVKRPVIYVGTGSCEAEEDAEESIRKIREYMEKHNWDAEVVEMGCIGLCSEEPVIDVHLPGKSRLSFRKATHSKVQGILDSVRSGKVNPNDILGQFKGSKQEAWPNIPLIDQHPWFANQKRQVLNGAGTLSPYSIADYLCRGGYRAFYRTVLSYVPDRVCELVEESGLQGRGGGGFPAGSKWKVALNTAGDEKYLICNADESDPGSFIDRAIIECNPHRLIEGIAIASYAIGTSRSFIYIRSGYPKTLAILELAIQQAKEFGILGSNIFTSGFNLDISILQGAGAFICGEETAMIASIEGRRGLPQTKPPYPAESGLFGKPTLVNNVETLVNIPLIVENGPEWFRETGTGSNPGTKVFSLSGSLVNKGFIEVPMGYKVSDIIYKIGGGMLENKKLKAVQIGGPMGVFISADHLDLEIGFQTMKEKGALLGSGGISVLDDTACMVNQSLKFMQFLQNESCGKCIPCREGSRSILEIIEQITRQPRDDGSHEALKRFKGIIQLEGLSTVIRETSLCGLGKNVPNLVISALTDFREEFEEHIFERKCSTGICRELRIFHINVDKCTGCNECPKVCPVNAIIGVPNVPHFIVEKKCNGCGDCMEVCNYDAIYFK